jgi:hypothetical protein
MRFSVLLVLTLTASVAAYAQRFEIVDQSGRVTAIAELGRGRLAVLERGSTERIEYIREVRYDSRDNRYWGFIDLQHNRALRFPSSGQGPMFAADLNELVPQFRQTVRTVRPLGIASNPNYPQPIAPHEIDYGLVNPFDPYGRYSSGYVPSVSLPPYGVSPGYGQYPGYSNSIYPPPVSRAQSIRLESRIVANPPLEPVSVDFANTSNRDLQVAIVDLATSSQAENFRIRPGERRSVVLQRDSGGQRVETYRTVDAYGFSATKQITTPVPPAVLYEVVVHEWAMQSIAIDRTGKSPNAIEDVNYQGRGIGRFPLPAGEALRPTTIDVLRVAKTASNPGEVAPLVPEDASVAPPSDEPLERALKDILNQQQLVPTR